MLSQKSILCALAAAVVGLAVSSTVAAGGGSSRRAVVLPALPTKPMVAGERVRIASDVRTLLADPLYKADVPGLIIGVWSPTQGVYRATFGKANLSSGRRPGLAGSFRIGSVSKTFTATVVLRLVEQGKLALNGRVKRYLPDLARRYPAIGTRSIAQLLGMRSGLPEYTDALAKRFPGAAHRVWSADELIDVAMRSGPVKPAGAAKSVYTNTNYVILGEVAQAVTGTPIDRLVRDTLLRPLGLSRTRYPYATEVRLPVPFTHGYVTASGSKELRDLGASVRPGTDVTGWNPSWGNAAGMMSSTLDDLARWGNGLLGNALLSKKLQQARLKTVPQTDAWTYGLGVLVLTGGQWVGHSGGIPGWSTWLLHNVKTGMTVVTSINACCGSVPGTFTYQLLHALYPETFLSGPPLPAGVPYQLSPTTSFTPTAGWLPDPEQSEKGSTLTALKNGAGFKLSDSLQLGSGQTLQTFADLFRKADATSANTRVSDVQPFTTSSGLTGATWTTRAPTQSTQTWLITNGTRLARFDGYGPVTAFAAIQPELETMAKSITMSAS